jgi:NADPH:quinone reductase-like Zn-dependent oxidoreductase
LWGFARLMGLWKLLPDGKASAFYNIQTRREQHPAEFTEDVQQLFKLLSGGKLSPAIEAIVPLSDVVSVHQRIDSADIAGKVVLRCNEG